MLTLGYEAFYSRGQDARNFFRVGQVFQMLWSVHDETLEAEAVADSEEDERWHEHWLQYEKIRPLSNNYMGPYTGPTTARRFLVVHQGIRSSYCL